MIFAAVYKLRSPQLPPSQSWLTKFIRNELKEYHFITTKPIAQQRTKAQDEPTVLKWFQEYGWFILERGIKPESIWNMDETGFRVGILGGERVIVPRATRSSTLQALKIKGVAAIRKAGLPIPPEFEDLIPDPEALQTEGEGEGESERG
ncbi:hypothetical protein VC83_00131 [Pseudogymnoascus destructans]|uniref:HTH CENPB-type domain-containing protein n=1 Tax=Pseudogymnoascus destructans TaxID=655981 RepID=A0A177AMS5_9PEZI|nr:uncharacterized protein VC83_00131 [Pseudogymnoascus destructans]OAF63379.1 hypothetical protein VC83_00131 [Pseudogymnoascus destructans]